MIWLSVNRDFFICRSFCDHCKSLYSKPRLFSGGTTGCHQDGVSSQVKICEFGDTTTSETVVLVGGSHAAQWLPALIDVATEKRFKILSITKSACPFGNIESSNDSCIEWNDKVVDEILNINPSLVITNSTRTEVGGRIEYVPESYVNQWKRLSNRGIKIIGIRDNPRFKFDIPICIDKNNDDHYLCSEPRSEMLMNSDPATYYKPLIMSVDLSKFLCSQDRCFSSFKGMPIYRDSHHISVHYARMMRGPLADQIGKQISK